MDTKNYKFAETPVELHQQKDKLRAEFKSHMREINVCLISFILLIIFLIYYNYTTITQETVFMIKLMVVNSITLLVMFGLYKRYSWLSDECFDRALLLGMINFLLNQDKFIEDFSNYLKDQQNN